MLLILLITKPGLQSVNICKFVHHLSTSLNLYWIHIVSANTLMYLLILYESNTNLD